MRRIVMVFEYIGTDFAGFQIQPNKRTVQGEIETALTRLLGENIKIYASGRTDKGQWKQGKQTPQDKPRIHRNPLQISL